jgi:hypothetical protein
MESQIIFILVLGAMKRKDLFRKQKIGYGYLSNINNISPHQHHCQRITTMYTTLTPILQKVLLVLCQH